MMPTPQQRKAQFDAVRSALDTCEAARTASDAAASKAGAEADQIGPLQTAYIRASMAFSSGTGDGASVDAAKKAYLAVLNAQGGDMSTAQADYVAFTTDWQALNAAVQGLLSDPGAVERV